MANQDKLELFRGKIDEIDSDILDLLTKRAKIAKDVGLLKGLLPNTDRKEKQNFLQG